MFVIGKDDPGVGAGAFAGVDADDHRAGHAGSDVEDGGVARSGLRATGVGVNVGDGGVVFDARVTGARKADSQLVYKLLCQ